MPSRGEKRREEREAGKNIGMSGSLQLDGSEVVVAVAVDGPPDAEGQRPYKTWIRGPATNHTNAEMVQLLALICSSITIGNAQGGQMSVQRSIDECKNIFGRALDGQVHRVMANALATRSLQTVQLERETPEEGQ